MGNNEQSEIVTNLATVADYDCHQLIAFNFGHFQPFIVVQHLREIGQYNCRAKMGWLWVTFDVVARLV